MEKLFFTLARVAGDKLTTRKLFPPAVLFIRVRVGVEAERNGKLSFGEQREGEKRLKFLSAISED